MQPLSGGESLITRESTKELRDDRLNRNPFVAGKAYEVIADSNGIVRLRTSDRVRGVMVVESPFLCSASLAYQKNGIATIRLTRQWEFLERYEVNSAIKDFDFATELRGDLDTEYRVHGFWDKAGTATATLRYRINGASSGALTGDGYAYQTNAADNTGTALALARVGGTEPASIMLWSTFYAASGQYRFTHGGNSQTFGTATTQTEVQNVGSKLHESTTQVVQLGIESSSAGDILAGSWFDLYRRPQFDKTKLTLWVY